MELIKVENGVSVLNAGASGELAKYERTIKELKAKQDDIKKMILEEMTAKNIKQIKDEVNNLTITYVNATTKEVFDSKRFRAENPALYDNYISISPVKSSIRISVK